jgi:hypothetical protein
LPSHRFPTSLRIGPHRYTVQVTRRLRGYRVGTIDYRRRHILIAMVNGATGQPLPPAEVRDTFWHEVTHGILNAMGHALNRDEDFVREFATLLTGAIDSARFDQET